MKISLFCLYNVCMSMLFASDFDGTLYMHGKEKGFRKEDLVSIRDFQKNGGLFGVCSGRSLSGIQACTKDAIHFDFYILGTGAQVLDQSGNILWQKVMDIDTAVSLYNPFKDQTHVIFHGERDVYTCEETGYAQIHISSPEEIIEKNDHIVGLSFGLHSQKEAEEAAERMNHDYAGKAYGYVNINMLDVVPSGCSKGEGLRKATALLHGTGTAGIGDSYNDIPLIDRADTGFTFHRSPQEVQKHADYVVDSVTEALKIIEHTKREQS